MEYSIDGDARICPEEYVDEKLSEREKEELLGYERSFQRLMADIMAAHHEEIKEFVMECLGYIREKYPSEDEEEENSQTSESEED